MDAPIRHPDVLPSLPSRAGGEQEAAVHADPEGRRWLRDLDPGSARYPRALAELHQLLLRAAYAELARRRGQRPLVGPDLDDLAHQAADDATMAITAKLPEFRGDSRFTTWAYKFVILEVSNKLGRYWRRHRTVALGDDSWNRLPDRLGVSPEQHAAAVELVDALRQTVAEELTVRQRRVFLALFVDGVPLDALAVELGSNRNAIYKTMFDARRKLRNALVAKGHMNTSATGAGRSKTDEE